MKKYEVYATEFFEQSVQNAVNYLWYKFCNEQAIEHLETGILKAKDKLETSADLLPIYREETGERFIRVNSMRYKMFFTLDEAKKEVWLRLLVHDLQDR